MLSGSRQLSDLFIRSDRIPQVHLPYNNINHCSPCVHTVITPALKADNSWLGETSSPAEKNASLFESQSVKPRFINLFGATMEVVLYFYGSTKLVFSF